MLEHFGAVDVEAFAELDGGFGDRHFEQTLALEQWPFPQIVAAQV
jgi:hypothetical protein